MVQTIMVPSEASLPCMLRYASVIMLFPLACTISSVPIQCMYCVSMYSSQVVCWDSELIQAHDVHRCIALEPWLPDQIRLSVSILCLHFISAR